MDTLIDTRPTDKEREIAYVAPRGFDDLSIEATSMHILELGKDLGFLMGDEGEKFNESRLVLRRMPQQLHNHNTEFAVKPLLPVDEEYKKELFGIVSADVLPDRVTDAVDRFVQQNQDEFQKAIATVDVFQGVPNKYQKAYFALGGYTPYWDELIGSFSTPKTLQDDLTEIAYVRFLLREVRRRHPDFKSENLGLLTPTTIKSGNHIFNTGLENLELFSLDYEKDGEISIPDSIKKPSPPNLDKYLTDIEDDDRSFFQSEEGQVLFRYFTTGSVRETLAYTETIAYGKALQDYLLKNNPALANQLDSLSKREYDATGFELLGIPTEKPIEELIWEKVYNSMPPGFSKPRGIKLEYVDTLKWRNGISDIIVPPEEREEFASIIGAAKVGNQIKFENGQTQHQDVLILYRQMIRRIIKEAPKDDLPDKVVNAFARAAIHELMEAWVTNQPEAYLDKLLAEFKKDEIGINDKDGLLERPEAIKKAYDNIGGIFFILGQRHHWEIEQIVESITAYNLYSEEMKVKHPHAYQAVKDLVYQDQTA